jgi:nucleotide-binding universal stress UspA family protein
MILIAYDGSDDARAAVEHAGRLFPGQPVTVLTVWQRFIDTMARYGSGGISMVVDYEQVDAEAERAALTQAQEGAELARESGLEASARVAVLETSVAEAILAAAGSLDAAAVVCGSRGYGGVRSIMVGSTSQHVLHHADRPVVVVPSPAVTRARSEHRHSLA